MRELILFRHAKAEATSPNGDRARVLSKTGRRRATEMGAKLAAEGIRPDLALVSNSARTLQTWELTGAAFPETRIEVLDELYDASAEEIALAVAAVAATAEVIIVVGHNPGLHAYVMKLLTRGGASASELARASTGFPTAVAAVFAVDEAGRPALKAVYDPREFGRQ